MNIVLTNDDGYTAPGLLAAYEAIRDLGDVHVIAPKTERSACSHTITLRNPITVERHEHDVYARVHAVDGTPADCVRLAFAALVDHPIDLIVSGINRGANAGVDTFYSGTVAGAREGSILGIRAIALSQAIRADLETDWEAATRAARVLVQQFMNEPMPGPGFWNINLPAPIPTDATDRVRRVPVAAHPMPMSFNHESSEDGKVLAFDYGASYWLREVTAPSDYTTIRGGEISVTAIPLFGRF